MTDMGMNSLSSIIITIDSNLMMTFQLKISLKNFLEKEIHSFSLMKQVSEKMVQEGNQYFTHHLEEMGWMDQHQIYLRFLIKWVNNINKEEVIINRKEDLVMKEEIKYKINNKKDKEDSSNNKINFNVKNPIN